MNSQKTTQYFTVVKKNPHQSVSTKFELNFAVQKLTDLTLKFSSTPSENERFNFFSSISSVHLVLATDQK